MNTVFNYYDFKKKKEFKYDVKVDLSGINLQSDASMSETDDNGSVSEVNLNEIVDENVNFIYGINGNLDPQTYIPDPNDSRYTDIQYRYEGMDVVEIDQIDFTTPNPTSITLGTPEITIPIKPRHTLMRDDVFTVVFPVTSMSGGIITTHNSNYNILTINIAPYTIDIPTFDSQDYYEDFINIDGHTGTNRIWVTLTGSDVPILNGEFEISSMQSTKSEFQIRVHDFYGSSFTNLPTISSIRVAYGGIKNRGHIVSRDAYAAIGMWNNNHFNTLNGLGVGTNAESNTFLNLGRVVTNGDERARGYLGKKEYYRRLRALRDKITPLGIEVVTNEFRRKVETVDGPLGFDFVNDVNYSYLHRGDTFNDAIIAARKFIEIKNKSNELLSLPTDEITPFTMSIKDVFVNQFDTSSELYDDFESNFISVINAIKSNRYVMSLVDIDNLRGTIRYEPKLYTKAEKDSLILSGVSETVMVSKDDSSTVNRFIDAYTQDNVTYPVPDTIFFQYMTYDYIGDDEVTYEILLRNRKKRVMWEVDVSIDTSNVNALIAAVHDLEESVKEVQAASAYLLYTLSPAVAAIVVVAIELVTKSFDRLEETIRKIKWYQKYTNQSVFPSGEMIYDANKTYGNQVSDAYLNALTDRNTYNQDGRISEGVFKYNKQYARFLIAVDFGTKRERYKTKNWLGIKTTSYRTIDLGVRWVEVYFIDTNTYSKYRKNDTPSGNSFTLNIPFTTLTRTDVNTVVASLSTPLADEIMNRQSTQCSITTSGVFISAYNGTFSGTIVDSSTITFTTTVDPYDNSSGGILETLVLSYQPTKSDDEPRNIRVTFNMPHLPYDDELRDKVFNDYGPFDQGEYANKRRGGDYTINAVGEIIENTDIPGWEIFHKSSKEVSAMRMGIDIYSKVQFLIKILETEFGKSRVNVIETMRSFDDQNTLQLGGAASNFLSWHNYGLAIKIKITEKDGMSPIKDGTSDMMRLLNIADGFCNAAKNGKLGTPMNVVWCGQLVTGPDIFVWEFLPIGVGHKDAIKFRDSIYQQKDPIAEHAYINVTENGYIVDANYTPTTNTPYIRKDSKGIADAIIINNEYWVHPKYIQNYQPPMGLILKDIQEFLSLIKGKMDGNGTQLTGRKLVSEWKAKNSVSFRQLVLFYGMTGSMSSARGLLAGDYIQKFQTIVNKFAEKDPVKFVKLYLGDTEYNNTKIYLEDLADSSYISLVDGTLVTPVLEARSIQPEGNGNTFGQKQVDYNTVEFGQYQGGAFIPEGDSRIITIKTDKSVIAGYENGTAITSDAVLLHTLVANQIVDEFNGILELFNGLNIKFMHDSFYTGSNKSLAPLLENEFGVIASQDIMTFDQLRDMYKRILINGTKVENDGTVRGAGANIEAQLDEDRNKIQSIFEPLISNAQLTGVRKVNITREKPIIQVMENGIKVEEVVKEIQRMRTPNVRDIL